MVEEVSRGEILMVASLDKNATLEERAQHFLGTILDDTLSWSCTDKQHDLSYAFAEILGKYCPDWLDPYWQEEK